MLFSLSDEVCLSHYRPTAVMRPSIKAGPDRETKTGVKTQREIKLHVAGGEYECENSDKCTSFLSGTSHVADSALRQVHVTVEKQTERERESHTDRLGPWGEKEGDKKRD